jgi:hypothetical protein
VCFAVGLVGGGVYVNGFKMIAKSVKKKSERELAMSGASVADTMGIGIADMLGLWVQACLFKHNHVSGALVSC